MTATCPTCGGPIKAGPGIDLDLNVAIVNGTALRLTPREAEVIAVLIEDQPGPVSTERLTAKIYGSGEWPTADPLSVFIAHLRRKLRGTGYSIQTVWGFGWRLLGEHIDATA